MSAKHRRFEPLIIFLILLAAVALPQGTAEADIGPHPTLEFEFDFSGLNASVDIDEVILFTCRDDDCVEREELWDVPGQTFGCDQDGCSGTLLTGGPTRQIEVRLADRTLTSQPFKKEGFYSHYKLIFLNDEIKVEFVYASEPSFGNIATITSVDGRIHQRLDLTMAVLFTLLVEIPLAGLFLLIFKARFLDMLWILLGNVISLAVVWFIVPLLPLTALSVTILVLLLSILIEWGVLGWLSGKRITWLKAGVISLVLNVASTIVGLFLS